MPAPTFREYPARVSGVIDGDTLEVCVDLGFNRITTTERLRLDGLNCPERNTERGREATEFTLRWLGRHPEITLRTRKTSKGTDEREKYGRIVAQVLADGGRSSLNLDLLFNGHADPYPR